MMMYGEFWSNHVMIVYHLSSINTIMTLSLIHYHHRYHIGTSDNIHLYVYSKRRYGELYQTNEPEDKKTIRYLLSKLSTSKLGDFIFGNYSRYTYCNFLYGSDNRELFLEHYHMLPWSYKWLLREEKSKLWNNQ